MILDKRELRIHVIEPINLLASIFDSKVLEIFFFFCYCYY